MARKTMWRQKQTRRRLFKKLCSLSMSSILSPDYHQEGDTSFYKIKPSAVARAGMKPPKNADLFLSIGPR